MKKIGELTFFERYPRICVFMLGLAVGAGVLMGLGLVREGAVLAWFPILWGGIGIGWYRYKHGTFNPFGP